MLTTKNAWIKTKFITKIHYCIHSLAKKSGKWDIGECASVKIKCISELGWLSNLTLQKDISTFAYKLPKCSQYSIPFDKDNSAGVSNLIEITSKNQKKINILFDAGWNLKQMENAFQREKITEMLQRKKINHLIISHEHFDHFWGVPNVFKQNPYIDLIIPNSFSKQGLSFLKGKDFPHANLFTEGNIHRGKLSKINFNQMQKLCDGCGLLGWNIPISQGVVGECALFFNIAGKGIVIATGCGHMGIVKLLETAKKEIKTQNVIHGIYGGIHLAPFGQPLANWENILKEISKQNLKVIGSNHCTGLSIVKKMIEMKMNVIKGRGQFGSKSKLYIGNGDVITFK